jgi:pectate lyase
MRFPRAFVPAVSFLALLGASASATAAHRDLGRETLDANDGWASLGTGTTGGSAAAPEQVYFVHNRQELVAALHNGVYPPPNPAAPSNVPKIIYVVGTIDGNVDDANEPLECVDYNRNGFTLEAFLLAYDPATWGRVPPSGPLEDARIASRNAQQDRVRIRPGSNTTIVGLGRHAVLKGIWLDLRGQAGQVGSRTNIIVRNLTFRDSFDCFPQWSPTDGALGSWNALYDSISLRDSDHVWVDHNTFEDVETADETLPHYFGVLFQVHDGLLDITNGSDLVTVSWNNFRNHDKTMLIGSSDGMTTDRGKLRVTFHHNSFESLGQRVPRVRFGQVHVYNNFYEIDNVGNYGYSWGVGIESAIFAENNFFKADQAISPDMFIERFNGTAIQARGTLVNGFFPRDRVDVVAAWNEVNDPDLLTTVAWTPELFKRIDPTWTVPITVSLLAGPFFWFLP